MKYLGSKKESKNPIYSEIVFDYLFYNELPLSHNKKHT